MHFKLHISCNNSAFENPGEELSRILTKLADYLADNGTDSLPKSLMDINGNTVGTVWLENEDGSIGEEEDNED